MKKIATLAVTAFALAACGTSDKADEAAQADNVEMPAEEAVNTIDEAATPVPAETGVAATDAAAPAGTPTDPTAKAVEEATVDAEKKM